MSISSSKTLAFAFVLAPATLFAGSEAGYLWSSSGRTVTIIAGDDIPDPVEVFPIGVHAANFTFVITDSESTVLAYTNSNVFDLDGAGTGTCRIYGFAWSGDFDQPTGVNVHELEATEDFDLSRNEISIERLGAGSVDGGWVLNDRNGYGRIRLNLNGDPKPFRVYSANHASTDTNYTFIITDDAGMVLAFPDTNVIDLSGAPPGTCYVYGISFTGTLDTTTGVHVSKVTADSENQSLSKNAIRADRREGNARRPRWWRW